MSYPTTRVLLLICMMTTVPMKSEQPVFDSGPSVLRDPSVLVCFAHLVSKGLYGFATYESAAFVVMRADHSLQCIDWPSTHEFKQARWSGPTPVGIVAVAHTHPSSSPDASPDDIKLARHIRIPIFILTPDIVSVVHNDGHVEMLVFHKPWILEAAMKGEAK
jgi:hypothetical protein